MANLLQTDNLAALETLSLMPNQPEILKKIQEVEHLLKPYEVVSIIFLVHTNAIKAYRDLEHYLNGASTNLISKYIEEAKDVKNLENEFYECLFLIKNYKLLRHFDIEAVNAVHQYSHKHLLPDIRVTLYKICENVVGSELESLLREMGESDFRYAEYMEMYLLKWISEERLSIEDKIDVESLVNCLVSIGNDHCAQQLRRYYPKEPAVLQQTSIKTMEADDAYVIIDPNNVGLCVIINQKKFNSDPSNPSFVLKERNGTEKDCESLKKMLRKFKFDVEIINDVVSTNIVNVIRNKVNNFFKPSHSIFLLIILSHGNKGVVYGSDSKPLDILYIDYCLLLPCLQGKPKVIIVQACQGDWYVKASKIETDAPVTVKEWPKDTLFCMATIPHFASYRHTEKGTWYIQTLCDILEKNPEDNIFSVLTKVNQKLYNEPVFDSEPNIRSIPEFKSRLEKDLYFKRKY